MTQMVKDLPAMQETWAQSLGWEDPLQKGMAIHSQLKYSANKTHKNSFAKRFQPSLCSACFLQLSHYFWASFLLARCLQ